MTTPTKLHEINAAVVGTGFIGPVHVEGLRRAGVRVHGVLGSTPEKSATCADALGIECAYRDLDELLADPAVHSVHVTTPNRLHLDMASRSLAAGKHVMCEKPLAMDVEESAELVRLARGADVATGVTYNIRSYGLCQEARARVRAGEIGAIRHITGSYAQDWLVHETDYNWRVLAEEGGVMRAMADVGTHWLDLVWSITGLEVESVCADLLTAHPTRLRPTGSVETFSGKSGASPSATERVEITTDDYGAVLLRFRGGARGSLWVSQVSAGRKNCIRLEIAGATGTLAWNSESPNELWVGRLDASNELFIRDPTLMSELARKSTDYPGGHNEGYPDTFKHCFRTFYTAVLDGSHRAAPPYPTFDDGHREIVLCDAIHRSHVERRWVDVTDDSRNP